MKDFLFYVLKFKNGKQLSVFNIILFELVFYIYMYLVMYIQNIYVNKIIILENIVDQLYYDLKGLK